MQKFSESEKLAAVQRYVDGNESCKAIANALGMDKSDLLLFIKRYEYHGVKAFIKNYTTYSMQYKLDVLNYMSEHRTSIRETTAIFNLSTTKMIRTWKKQFESGGIEALEPKEKGHPSMNKETNKQTKKLLPAEGSIEALQVELERLRMENAYLKKLNALVQNKEKSPNKTKHK
ncbi:Transposase and inactivated derivatives [Bacillus sp. 491mf]|nr:Transposase and inactivated derivatives [Bacillus sp. 491mf]